MYMFDTLLVEYKNGHYGDQDVEANHPSRREATWISARSRDYLLTSILVQERNHSDKDVLAIIESSQFHLDQKRDLPVHYHSMH